jgi:hypothetical protein
MAPRRAKSSPVAAVPAYDAQGTQVDPLGGWKQSKSVTRGISAYHASEIEQRFRVLQAKYNSGGSLPKPPAFDSATWLKMPTPPPGVLPKKIAMDFNPFGGAGWGGAGFGSIGAEGVTFFGYPYLSELQQRAEFRLLTETVSEEVTRRWGEIKASGSADKSDKVNAIEREFKRLKVREKFRRCDELDNYFGRGHMYLDFGQNLSDAELRIPVGDGWDTTSASKCNPDNPLRTIKVVEPLWIWPGIYNSTDPANDDWYHPPTWWMMSREYHRSRLLTFVSREMPDILKPAWCFGGLSLSQMAQPYVEIWLNTRQSVSTMVQNYSLWHLRTNMQDVLSGASPDKMMGRIESLVFGKNGGVMATDMQSEDLLNVAAPLSGLHELQAQAQEHMSAVSKIPLVKLTGISPSGLNASSEGEIKVFGDMIHARQEFLHNDHVNTVLGFVQLSLFGEVDPDITFEWAPLDEMSDKEWAELRKMEAETDGMLIDKGVISPEESRKRIGEDQESPYDGLDIANVPDLRLEEQQGLIPKGGGKGEAETMGGVGTADGSDAPTDPWERAFAAYQQAGGPDATNDGWRAVLSGFATDDVLEGWKKVFAQREWI